MDQQLQNMKHRCSTSHRRFCLHSSRADNRSEYIRIYQKKSEQIVYRVSFQRSNINTYMYVRPDLHCSNSTSDYSNQPPFHPSLLPSSHEPTNRTTILRCVRACDMEYTGHRQPPTITITIPNSPISIQMSAPQTLPKSVVMTNEADARRSQSITVELTLTSGARLIYGVRGREIIAIRISMVPHRLTSANWRLE